MATTWSHARPNNGLESPFLAKHQHMHLPLLRQNNSTLLEHLYRLTTDEDNHTAESREKLWVSCNPRSERACLMLREIQESVTPGSPLGVDCFNLAVTNLMAEEADNFQHKKCMGWRHIYQVCKTDSTPADEYSCPKFTSSQFACEVFGAHLVLIPVMHDGDWSLYAFNMCDRKLSILDSSSRNPEERHREIRCKISGVLNETLATLSDGSQDDICSGECQFPMVPTQQDRNDCGYFVFNFMSLWDGHQLARSFLQESRELRKEFLAYMMCFKENEAALPPLVATCISKLCEETKMARKHRRTWAMYPMDSRLLHAVSRGQLADFDNLLDLEENRVTTPGHPAPATPQNAAGGGVANEAVIDVPNDNAAGGGVANVATDDPGVATSEQPPTENGEARGGESERSTSVSPVGAAEDTWIVVLVLPLPPLSSILLGGVTSAGDGVLHIAARHCYLELVIHVCSRAGITIQRPGENAAAAAPAPAATGSQQQQQGSLPFAEFWRARNHMGETCLHEAVRSGSVDMVRLLMDVDAALNDEATLPLVQILDDNGTSPLYLATTTSHDNGIVNALTFTHYKYHVSHAGPAGRTALHAAILSSGNRAEENCKVLLRWKSSLATTQDESGRTPLHYTGRLITQLLLDHDPLSGYIADSEGSLPIHVAAKMGRLDIIKKLLDACPSCDSACDAAGQTFLHVAVKHSRDNLVKYLCTDPKLRTILNMRDHNGDTALHMAVQKANWRIFCFLYSNNEVSLTTVNKQGRTPVDSAIICTDKLSLKQVHVAWMRNDLLADGAGVGPRERDGFPFRCSVMSEIEKEKESKRLSKSAGLLGAVVFLILTVSLQTPFDLAEKLHSVKIGSTLSGKGKEKMFGEFINKDTQVLCFSTFAIFFLTVAGFPYAGLGVRTIFLSYGGLFVWCTVLLFLLSFRDGMSLVYSGHGVVGFFVLIAIDVLIAGFGVAVLILEPHRLFAQASARLRRLGFRRWLCSLFRYHATGSGTPTTNVLLLLCSFIFLLTMIGAVSFLDHSIKM